MSLNSWRWPPQSMQPPSPLVLCSSAVFFKKKIQSPDHRHNVRRKSCAPGLEKDFCFATGRIYIVCARLVTQCCRAHSSCVSLRLESGVQNIDLPYVHVLLWLGYRFSAVHGTQKSTKSVPMKNVRRPSVSSARFVNISLNIPPLPPKSPFLYSTYL